MHISIEAYKNAKTSFKVLFTQNIGSFWIGAHIAIFLPFVLFVSLIFYFLLT